MAGNIITVDVDFRAVSGSIDSLRRSLDNIVDTSALKRTMGVELDKLAQKARALGEEAQRGFKNTSSLDNFERKLRTLFLDVQRQIPEMSKFGFDQIKWDRIAPDMTERMSQLKNARMEAMRRRSNPEAAAMQDFLANNSERKMKELLRGTGINLDTKSLKDFNEAVGTVLARTEGELENFTTRLNNARDGVSGGRASTLKRTLDENVAMADRFFTKDPATRRSNVAGQERETKTFLKAAEGERELSQLRNLYTNLERMATLIDTNKLTSGREGVSASQRLSSLFKFNAKGDPTSIIGSDMLEKTRNVKNLYTTWRSQLESYVGTLAEQEHLTVEPLRIDQLENEVRKREKTVKNLTEVRGRTAAYSPNAVKAQANEEYEQTGQAIRDLRNQMMQDFSAGSSLTNELEALGASSLAASGQIEQARERLLQLNQTVSKMNSFEMFIQRFFGMYTIVRYIRQGITSIINSIRELDTAITSIAMVSKNLNQDQLWGQMKNYIGMAKQYGSSISNVYTVSQLFYQQGLQTSDVMSMSAEALKLAKIAAIDYSQAADYLTVAVRAFNMEMAESSRVTDVYSALAASTASSVSELATAMSKTASSAANVGSSFENTTAMMAVMIATTRESPENIGSALKSIISRYGSLTKDISAVVDEEGEALSYNAVDAALQSVGITLKTTSGQFRNFDEVILELAEKWDTLDTLSQRYIATQMAGNRQQSRFIALVSNADDLKEAMKTANDAEDEGVIQTLTAMDSLETKITQVKTAWQEMYVSSGIEAPMKAIVGGLANALSTMNGRGTMTTITNLMNAFLLLKDVVVMVFRSIRSNIESSMEETFTNIGKQVTEAIESAAEKLQTAPPAVTPAVDASEAVESAQEAGEQISEALETNADASASASQAAENIAESITQPIAEVPNQVAGAVEQINEELEKVGQVTPAESQPTPIEEQAAPQVGLAGYIGDSRDRLSRVDKAINSAFETAETGDSSYSTLFSAIEEQLNALPEMASGAGHAITQELMTGISEDNFEIGRAFDKISDALAEIYESNGFVESIAPPAEAIVAPVVENIEKNPISFDGLKEEFEKTGISTEAMQQLFDSVDLSQSFEDIKRQIIVGLSNLPGMTSKLMGFVIQGLNEGMSSGDVSSSAAARALEIINAIKSTLGIASPSTVMIAIGEFIIAGLEEGLISSIGDIDGIITALKEKFISSSEETTGKLEELFNMHSLGDKNGLEEYFKNCLSSADDVAKRMQDINDQYQTMGSMQGVVDNPITKLKDLMYIAKAPLVKELKANGLENDEVLQNIGAGARFPDSATDAEIQKAQIRQGVEELKKRTSARNTLSFRAVSKIAKDMPSQLDDGTYWNEKGGYGNSPFAVSWNKGTHMGGRMYGPSIREIYGDKSRFTEGMARTYITSEAGRKYDNGALRDAFNPQVPYDSQGVRDSITTPKVVFRGLKEGAVRDDFRDFHHYSTSLRAANSYTDGAKNGEATIIATLARGIDTAGSSIDDGQFETRLPYLFENGSFARGTAAAFPVRNQQDLEYVRAFAEAAERIAGETGLYSNETTAAIEKERLATLAKLSAGAQYSGIAAEGETRHSFRDLRMNAKTALDPLTLNEGINPAILRGTADYLKSENEGLDFSSLLDNVDFESGDLSAIKEQILDAFDGVKGMTPEIGENIVTGLTQGITSEDATSAPTMVANQVIAAFRTAFQVHSPSEVMIEIGQFLIAGLKEGLIQNLGDIDGILKLLSSKFESFSEETKETLSNVFDYGSKDDAAWLAKQSYQQARLEELNQEIQAKFQEQRENGTLNLDSATKIVNDATQGFIQKYSNDENMKGLGIDNSVNPVWRPDAKFLKGYEEEIYQANLQLAKRIADENPEIKTEPIYVASKSNRELDPERAEQTALERYIRHQRYAEGLSVAAEAKDKILENGNSPAFQENQLSTAGTWIVKHRNAADYAEATIESPENTIASWVNSVNTWGLNRKDGLEGLQIFGRTLSDLISLPVSTYKGVHFNATDFKGPKDGSGEDIVSYSFDPSVAEEYAKGHNNYGIFQFGESSGISVLLSRIMDTFGGQEASRDTIQSELFVPKIFNWEAMQQGLIRTFPTNSEKSVDIVSQFGGAAERLVQLFGLISSSGVNLINVLEALARQDIASIVLQSDQARKNDELAKNALNTGAVETLKTNLGERFAYEYNPNGQDTLRAEANFIASRFAQKGYDMSKFSFDSTGMLDENGAYRMLPEEMAARITQQIGSYLGFRNDGAKIEDTTQIVDEGKQAYANLTGSNPSLNIREILATSMSELPATINGGIEGYLALLTEKMANSDLSSDMISSMLKPLFSTVSDELNEVNESRDSINSGALTLFDRYYNPTAFDFVNQLDTSTQKLVETNLQKSPEGATQADALLFTFEHLKGEAQAQGYDISGFEIEGLVQGLTDGQGNLIGPATAAAQAISNAIKAYLGINSPALDGIRSGEYEVEGLVQGLQQAAPEAFAAAQQVAEGMSKALWDKISQDKGVEALEKKFNSVTAALNEEKFNQNRLKAKEEALMPKRLNKEQLPDELINDRDENGQYSAERLKDFRRLGFKGSDSSIQKNVAQIADLRRQQMSGQESIANLEGIRTSVAEQLLNSISAKGEEFKEADRSQLIDSALKEKFDYSSGLEEIAMSSEEGTGSDDYLVAATLGSALDAKYEELIKGIESIDEINAIKTQYLADAKLLMSNPTDTTQNDLTIFSNDFSLRLDQYHGYLESLSTAFQNGTIDEGVYEDLKASLGTSLTTVEKTEDWLNNLSKFRAKLGTYNLKVDDNGELAPIDPNAGNGSGGKEGKGLGKIGSNSSFALQMAGRAITSLSTLVKAQAGSRFDGGALLNSAGAGVTAAGAIMRGLASNNIVGMISGFITALPNVITTIQNLTNTFVNDQKRLESLSKDSSDKKNESIKSKAEVKNLQEVLDKTKKLTQERYKSTEANEEFLDYMNEITSSYPELAASFDAEGNSVINLTALYTKLAEEKLKASDAYVESAEADYKLANTRLDVYNKNMAKIPANMINRDETGVAMGLTLPGISEGFLENIGDYTLFGSNYFLKEDIARAKEENPYMNDRAIEGLLLEQGKVVNPEEFSVDLLSLSTNEILSGFDMSEKITGDMFYTANAVREALLASGMATEDGLGKASEWTLAQYLNYIDLANSLQATLASTVYQARIDAGAAEVQSYAATFNPTGKDKFFNELYNNKELQSLYSSAMAEKWDSLGDDQGLYDNDYAKFLEQEGQNVIAEFEEQYGIHDLFNSLTSKKQEQFLEAISNISKYQTKDDFVKAIDEIIGGGNEELDARLREFFTNSNKAAETLFEDQITQFTNQYGEVLGNQDLMKEISTDAQDAYLADLSEVSNLIDAGSFSQGIKLSEGYNNLWTKIESLEGQAAIDIESLAKEFDFTTLSGAENAIKAVEKYGKDNNFDVSEIVASMKEIQENIILNATTISKDVLDKTKKASEKIKGLTSSVDFEDTTNDLAAMNKDVADGQRISFGEGYEVDSSGELVRTVDGAIAARKAVIDKFTSDTNKDIDRIKQQQDLFTASGLDINKENFTMIKNTPLTNAESTLTSLGISLDYFNGVISQLNNAQRQFGRDAEGNVTDWDFFDGDFGGLDEFAKLFGKESWSDILRDHETYGPIIDVVERGLQNGSSSAEVMLSVIKEYATSQEALDDAIAEQAVGIEALTKQYQSAVYSSLDFSKVVGMSSSSADDFKRNLAIYLASTKDMDASVAETYASGYLQLLQMGGDEALKAYQNIAIADNFDFSVAKSLYESRSENFTSALSQMLSGQVGEILDAATVQMLGSGVSNIAENIGSEENPIWKITASSEQLMNQAYLLYNTIANITDDSSITIGKINESLTSFLDAKFNQSETAIGVLSSDSVGYDSLSTLATSLGIRLDSWINSYTGEVLDGINGLTSIGNGNYQITDWNAFVGELGIALDNTAHDVIEAYASYISNKGSSSSASAMSSIASNINSISADSIAKLAESLGLGYEIFADAAFKDNGDGTFAMNESKFLGVLKGYNIELTKELENSIISMVGNSFTGVTSAISNLTAGSSNYTDLLTSVKELEKYGIYASGSISYDDTLNTFVMDAGASRAAIVTYLQNANRELEVLGIGEAQRSEIITGMIDQTIAGAANGIDFSSYLSNRDASTRDTLSKSIDAYIKTLESFGIEINETSESIIATLDEGGIAAVEAYKELAKLQGKVLTTEDYKAAYMSKINNLEAASEQYSGQVNDIVSDEVAAALVASGYRLQGIGRDANIITSVGKVEKAYRKYYEAIKATNQATISQINQAAADWLSQTTNAETSAMSFLSSASGFSASDLQNLGDAFNFDIGQLFNQNGELTAGWESIMSYAGNGSYQIDDWNKFVDKINEINGTVIDKSSKAYLDAYSSWVDSMISNETDAAGKLEDTARNLTKVKNGEKINLTALESIYGSDNIAEELRKYGITYQNGIGEIVNANIANLNALISDLTTKAGEDEKLKSTVNEMKDALLDMINGYSEALGKALGGDIGYFDANGLASAFNLNLEKDFTETGKGLQISQQAATKIYLEMKQIDQLAAKITLNDLVNDGKLFGNGIKNASDLAREMRTIQVALGQVTASAAEKEQARLNTLGMSTKELERQLVLYQDMQAAMLDNPDSWKLADKDLTKPIQAALNAWESAGKWMDALNKADKSGNTHNMLGVQDFTNMVNFVADNVVGAAENFMGTGLTASEMIQKGYSALKNVDGNTYVDLSKIGVNFLSGSEDMGANITKGINSLAQSQVDMLDGVIAMLEVIVAMEQLGDIDIDNDGTLEMGEIFEGWTKDWSKGSMLMSTLMMDAEETQVFTDKYMQAVGKIKQQLEKDGKDTELGKAMKQMSVNGKSMYDMLINNDFVGTGITADAWQKYVNGLYQMAMSGDYDLENLMTSFANEMAKADIGEMITIDLEGNKKVYIKDGSVYTIDYDSESFKKALGVALGLKKGKKASNAQIQEAQALIEKYYATPEELNVGDTTRAMLLTGQITYEVDKNGVPIRYFFNGTEYSPEQFNSGIIASDAALAGGPGKEISDKVVEDTDGGTTTTVTKKVDSGLEYKLEVYVDENGNMTTTYIGPDGTEADSYDELVNKLVEKEIESNPSDYENLSEAEKVIKARRKIKADVTPEIEPITDGDTLIGDKNNKAWEAVSQMSLKEIEDQLKNDLDPQVIADKLENGEPIKVNLNGQEFEVTPPEGLDLNDEGAMNAWYASLSQQLQAGVQENLQNEMLAQQISSAVTTALTTAFSGGVDGKAPTIDLSKVTVKIGDNITVENGLDELKGKIQQALDEMTLDDFKKEIDITLVFGGVTPPTGGNGGTYPGFPGAQGAQGFSVSAEKVDAASSTIDAPSAKIDANGLKIEATNVNVGNKGGATKQPKITKGTGATGKTSGGTETKSSTRGGGIGTGSMKVSSNAADATSKINAIATTTATASTQAANSIKQQIPAAGTAAASKVASAFTSTMSGIKSKSVGVTVKVSYPSMVSVGAKVTLTVTGTGAGSVTGTFSGSQPTRTTATAAKGNVALAKGTAMASGSTKTLMGELGPELVVSNGRYYTVGNNGAEFVDLPEDAIVFNHKQTASLLGRGRTGRGDAINGERKAIAFAGGNASGPAMASAAAALAAMKELRAMWASLASASAKDLGRKASGGGGGGGGGDDAKNYLADLNRWYNLMKQIETISGELTTHEKARAAYINAMTEDGVQYVKSLERSVELLEAQIDKNKTLRNLTRDYYDKRVEDLKDSPYGQIVEVLSDGTVQYKDEGFRLLAQLVETTGAEGVRAKYTSAEQLQMIAAAGFDISLLDYKSDGTEAKSDDERLEVFWDEVDGWTAELEEMYKNIQDYDQQIEDLVKDLENLAEEINKIIVDAKTKLANAIEGKLQKAIDSLQSELDAIKKASEKYADGLSKALDKEKSMYDKQKGSQELTSLQRQLAILQRTGGSASEIKSLQDQIDSKLQDNYFEGQQEEIDKIKEAVDAQTQSLETQIDIMKESLEYQKKNGLFWAQVDEMISAAINNNMDWQSLVDFIAIFNPDYAAMSADELQQQLYTGADSIGILMQQALGFIHDDAYSTVTNLIQEHTKSIANDTADILGNIRDIENHLFAAEDDEHSAQHAGPSGQAFSGLSPDDARAAVIESYDATDDATFGTNYDTGLEQGLRVDQAGVYADLLRQDNGDTKRASAYAAAIKAGKTSDQALSYANGVADGKISQAAQTNIGTLGTVNSYKDFLRNMEQKYGKGAADQSSRAKYIDWLLNGSSSANMKTARNSLNNMLSGNLLTEDEKSMIRELIRMYDANQLKENQGLSGLGAAATVGLNNDLGYQSTITGDYMVAAVKDKNVPYTTSEFKSDSKTTWTNSAGKAEKGTAIPANTGLHVVRFGGSSSMSSAFVRWYDPKGNLHNSYVYLNGDQQAELLKNSELAELKKNNQLPHFLNGGLVDFTGPAWLDGSSSKPEAILSNSDYNLLKDNLLNGTNPSLTETLNTITALANSIADLASSVEHNDGIVFENVNLTLEAGTIANDYDAKRAGQNIMEEMMKIARKSGNISITRR